MLKRLARLTGALAAGALLAGITTTSANVTGSGTPPPGATKVACPSGSGDCYLKGTPPAGSTPTSTANILIHG